MFDRPDPIDISQHEEAALFLSVRSPSLVASSTLVLLLAFTAGSGCGAKMEEPGAAVEAPRAPDPAREAREAARAEELANALVSLSEIDVTEVRVALARWQPQLETLGVWPKLHGTFVTLGVTVDQLEKIATLAKEGDAAAILEPAISGMLALDPILTEESARFEPDQERFIDLINRDASAREMEEVHRDIAVGGAIFTTAGNNFALFSVATAALARNGSPKTRRAAFGALETALPRMSFGRKHVERAMRLCHEQEEEPATRSRFEATMARLEVPLAMPEGATTATAVEASLIPGP